MGARPLGGRAWLPGPRGPCRALALLKRLTTQERTSPALGEVSRRPPARQQQPGSRVRTGPWTPRPRRPWQGPTWPQPQRGPTGGKKRRRLSACLGRRAGRAVPTRGGRPGRRLRGRAPSRGVSFWEAAGARAPCAPEPRPGSGVGGCPKPARSPAMTAAAGRGGRRVPRAPIGAP